ncbi:unnamed protein product [Paramecium sonneborni]|uniref:Uncharacterized protein n=1 Tax=Paramecium sonneborni TaxID=65129 RepID=A0A8S1RY19_9CILI|nr:unnamed protein product [Paramecium sonneborni]
MLLSIQQFLLQNQLNQVQYLKRKQMKKSLLLYGILQNQLLLDNYLKFLINNMIYIQEMFFQRLNLCTWKQCMQKSHKKKNTFWINQSQKYQRYQSLEIY